MVLALIKAAITANRLKAAGRAVFTLAEVGGIALSAAHLADEVARAIMGDDYDPALRDLAEQVIEAGREHDARLHEIVQVNDDINNVVGGINSLTEIVLDFGERQELVRERLEELVALRLTLSTTTPRTYTWFETIRLRALTGLTLEDVAEEVAALKAVNGPNYVNMGYFAAELAGVLGMRAWAHWRGAGARPPSGALGQVPAGEIPPDPRRLSTASQQQARTRLARLKAGIAAIGTPVARAYQVAAHNPKITASVRAVVSSATFAMGLFFLVEKVKGRNEAMVVLREMLAHYERVTPVYDAVLNGASDSATLEAVGALFDIDLDELGADARASLEAGYRSIQAEYDAMLADILDGMDAAYEDMIEEFEAVAMEADRPIIDQLRAAHHAHQQARLIALDTTRSGERRASEGIIEARDAFIATVGDQLNETLAALSEAIVNHNVYRMLETAAANLADKKQRIESEMEALRAANPGWPEEVFDVIRAEKEAALERDIVSEAGRLASDFDQLFAGRTVFETAAEVEEALRRLMDELLSLDVADLDAPGRAGAGDAGSLAAEIPGLRAAEIIGLRLEDALVAVRSAGLEEQLEVEISGDEARQGYAVAAERLRDAMRVRVAIAEPRLDTIEQIGAVHAQRLADAGLDVRRLSEVDVASLDIDGISAGRLSRWQRDAQWLVIAPFLDGNGAALLAHGLDLEPAQAADWLAGKSDDDVDAELTRAGDRVRLPDGYLEANRIILAAAVRHAARRIG